MDFRQQAREVFWSAHDKENYTCPECGRDIGEVAQFQVHHKDENIRNDDLDNLIGLCRECHYELHGDWTRRYRPQGIRGREERYMRIR